MLRAGSWRDEVKIQHDRIDLFVYGQRSVGVSTLIESWMGDQRSRTIVLDDRKKLLRVRKVRDEIELRNNIRISQNRPHGVLFVFDITQTTSFMYLIAFLQTAKSIFKSNTIRYLVGTKRDLRTGIDEDAAQISIQDGVMLAMRNLMRYRETSALSGEGVHGAFMSVIFDVHQLGVRLEQQSLIANLGSYMSLPRKGGSKELLVDFERKMSVDSDTSDCSSVISSGVDLHDIIESAEYSGNEDDSESGESECPRECYEESMREDFNTSKL